MLDMKKIKAELNEHRHRFEWNIEQRTGHLLKRIALLESCNATLSAKLALAHKELTALKWPTSPLSKKDAERINRTAKLYVMNSRVQELNGSNEQGELDENATAA